MPRKKKQEGAAGSAPSAEQAAVVAAVDTAAAIPPPQAEVLTVNQQPESKIEGDGASGDTMPESGDRENGSEVLTEASAEAPPETEATPAIDAEEFFKEPPPEYPQRLRVTNNTRMPVQVVVVPLQLGPAPSFADVTVHGEREHEALLSDLDALRALNGFDGNAFEVNPITEDDTA